MSIPVHDFDSCSYCRNGSKAYWYITSSAVYHLSNGYVPPTETATPLVNPKSETTVLRRPAMVWRCNSCHAEGPAESKTFHHFVGCQAPAVRYGTSLNAAKDKIAAQIAGREIGRLNLDACSPDKPRGVFASIDDSPSTPAPVAGCKYADGFLTGIRVYTDAEWAEVTTRAAVDRIGLDAHQAELGKFREDRFQKARAQFCRSRREWPTCKYGGTVNLSTSSHAVLAYTELTLVCSLCSKPEARA